MYQMVKVIKKNFKLLLRSKSSMFILILGPLLIIFLVGIAFNNSNLYQLRVGVYSPEYSNLSNSILSSLEEKNFQLLYYDSEWDCTESIKIGESNLCMVISKDLSINSEMDNSIDLFVDYSQFNLAWMVIETVSSDVSAAATNVTTTLASKLLRKIETIEKEVGKNQEALKRLMEYNKEINGGAAKIKLDVSKQNLGMDLTDFQTSNITSLSESMESRVEFVASEMARTLMSLRITINHFNITFEEKENSLNLINQTLVKSNLMKTQFKGKSNEVKTLVLEMDDLLADLSYRLNQAEGANKASLESITFIRETLKSDMSDLLGLQKSFNSINQGISSLEVKNADDIAIPIKTSINSINKESTHLNYLYPSLIILMVMFVSIILSSTLVKIETTSKAYIRNFITPTRDIVFVLGTYFTSMILVVLQVIVLIAASSFFLPFSKTIFPSFFIIILSATLFSFLGMALGYLFKSEEGVTLASISLSSVLLIFSDLLLPLESMPEKIRLIANYNPFVISSLLLKKTLLFGYGFSKLADPVILLFIISLIIFLLILFFHGSFKHKLLLKAERFHRKK